jgi:hypothetical protein
MFTVQLRQERERVSPTLPNLHHYPVFTNLGRVAKRVEAI